MQPRAATNVVDASRSDLEQKAIEEGFLHKPQGVPEKTPTKDDVQHREDEKAEGDEQGLQTRAPWTKVK